MNWDLDYGCVVWIDTVLDWDKLGYGQRNIKKHDDIKTNKKRVKRKQT